MNKIPVYALLFALAFPISASDPKSMLLHEEPLPSIATPDLSSTLDKSFRVAKGRWTPEKGEITVVNIPEEKHIPVLHHLVGLANAVIEVEFMMPGPGSFLVGCDSNKHVGRVIINSAGMRIAEDSVKPSHTIASLKSKPKPGRWQKLRVEWKGDRIAATLDGKILEGQHPYLATEKTRSWLAATNGVKIRNFSISGK